MPFLRDIGFSKVSFGFGLPELSGLICLVLSIRNSTEKGGGGSGTPGRDFPITLNKQQEGKGRRRNPELPGEISPLLWMRTEDAV